MLIMVMGVSGAGKSTLGAALAEKLGWIFLDSDDLHSSQNLVKMRQGHALSDVDRTPWLALIGERMQAFDRAGQSAIIACSALKRSYRNQFRAAAPTLRLVYLKAERAETERRLRERQGHFMPVELLDSQFAVLEAPAADEHPMVVDASLPLDQKAELVLGCIQSNDRRC